MQAILYTSNTGSTARYAQMLGQRLDLPVYSAKEAAKALPRGAQVLYLGWLMAGGIKGYKVDLYFDTFAECYQFGVRTCTAYILK